MKKEIKKILDTLAETDRQMLIAIKQLRKEVDELNKKINR